MPDIPNVKIKNGSARIEVDTGVYKLDAVLTSSYHYIDEYFVYIDQKEKGKSGIAVELTPKKKKSEATIKKVAAGFYNVLLAETLRLKIHRQSRKFREEMLEKAIAYALSPPSGEPAGRKDESPDAAGKQSLELDEELKKIIEKVKTMDYRDDPLGIAVPISGDTPRKKTGGAGKKKKI